MNDLSNKIIVITGGNGLLGRAIIDFLLSFDAICINIDIKPYLKENVHNYTADITQSEELAKVIEQIVEKYSIIDGWVNNAYPRTSDYGSTFDNMTMDSWRKNVDLQLNSYVDACKQISDVFKKQKSGSIINMASIYGVVGPDFTVYENTPLVNPAPYAAIKGGLINFSRYLASWLGPHGVRVNCVSPGGIFDNQNPTFVSQYESKVPLRRMGKPDDIAPAVAFLLSDMSKYITGHNLLVDGGWTAI